MLTYIVQTFFTDKSTFIQEENVQVEILTFCPSHCFWCMLFVNLLKITSNDWHVLSESQKNKLQFSTFYLKSNKKPKTKE